MRISFSSHSIHIHLNKQTKDWTEKAYAAQQNKLHLTQQICGHYSAMIDRDIFCLFSFKEISFISLFMGPASPSTTHKHTTHLSVSLSHLIMMISCLNFSNIMIIVIVIDLLIRIASFCSIRGGSENFILKANGKARPRHASSSHHIYEISSF